MTAPCFRDKYQLARCCAPSEADRITGYFSQDDFIKVHRHNCPNLAKADPARLMSLSWEEITAPGNATPPAEFQELDATDLAVLNHHKMCDIDYSLMVARVLRIGKQEAFERHQKLRNLGLLERVDAVMVRYRKHSAKQKWIKHRNHTYYRLTEKGLRCIDRHGSEEPENSTSDDTPPT